MDMPFVIRLCAPLVHAALIQAIAEIKQLPLWTKTSGRIFDLDWFVNTWNEQSLPVLEELFIWAVYRWFKFDDLWDEFKKSLTVDGEQGSRCERLNFYRRIPESKDNSVQDKNCVRYLNRLMWSGYCAGIGMRCRRSDETGFLLEPGICTVLDD